MRPGPTRRPADAAEATGPGAGLLSFIVPARDERTLLPSTLAAIDRAVHGRYEHEVIVVDNGSSDGTPEIARGAGCRVVARPEGTIGALRNAGVRASSGSYLVFVDADVVLAPAWGERIAAVLAELDGAPRTLTGGMCVVPPRASRIERLWFAPRDPTNFSHIGSGHLLTTRSFFDELGGFDESLETGEDNDLSVRAVKAGGRIAPDPALVAEHRGFPHTLREFARREVWHGRGDFATFGAVARSPVALAALAWGAAHLALVGALLTGRWAIATAAAAFVILLCAASSWRKYRAQPLPVRLANAALFYVYYAARLLAAVVARPRRARGDPPS